MSEPWSQETRDGWFLGLLAVTTVACVYLFSPFLYVLASAAVVVIVSWPLYLRILERVKGRSAVAASLATMLLLLLVFGPLSTIAYLFVVEGLQLGQAAMEWAQGEQFQLFLQSLDNLGDDPRVAAVLAYLPASVDSYLEELDIIASIAGPLQQGLVMALNTFSGLLPQLISGTVSAGIDAMIFCFAILTFYMEGPRLVEAVKKLSPIDNDYEDRLFGVFAEFANNMVVASLATAAVQGMVASLGYAIAGVDRVIFLGILTAVFSFIPLVGTAAVWVPTAVAVGLVSGWGWALFVALWSVSFTGTVDNLLKPLFLRGNTNIHPLLIFLAVFGGMAWLGIPGALVGPLIVALFLAMYTMYLEDFLGEQSPEPVEAEPAGWLEVAKRWVGLSGGEPETSEPVSEAGTLAVAEPVDPQEREAEARTPASSKEA